MVKFIFAGAAVCADIRHPETAALWHTEETGRGRPLFRLSASPAETEAEKRRGATDAGAENAVLHREVMKALGSHEGFLLEGAAVIAAYNRGIAFFSPDKETRLRYARAWCALLGEGCRILGDGETAVRYLADGDPYVFPSPFGDPRIYSGQKGVRLFHLCFLTGGGENRTETVKESDTGFRSHVLTEPSSAADTGKTVSRFLAMTDYRRILWDGKDASAEEAYLALFGHTEKELREHGTCVSAISGTSMLPLLRQGIDMAVIVPPRFPLRKYDIPLYRKYDHYTLHRVVKVRRNGEYVIRGDNRTDNEYGITDRDVVGLLSAVIREDGVVAADDPAFVKKGKEIVRTYPLRLIRARWKALGKKLTGGSRQSRSG